MSTLVTPPKSDPKTGAELHVHMYRRMLMIRLFEEQVNDLYTRALMPGLAHLYIGEEAVAVGVCEALHPDDVAPTMNALKKASRTGNPINIAHRVKTTDNKWKWLRARGLALYGSTGEIVRWYGGCEDIHKLKELEEA